MQIRWKKYGNYAITANNYSIAKCIVALNAKYVLWKLPNKLIKIYNTPQEAKNEAMALINAESTIPNNNAEGVIGQGKSTGGYDRGK